MLGTKLALMMICWTKGWTLMNMISVLQKHWTCWVVLEHYNNDTFDLKKKGVRKKLFYIQRFKYITDCLKFEESVATALVKVDNCVPCIEHLHNLIIEKLMTMFFCASLDEISRSNKTARKRQANINTMAYGTPEDPGNYQARLIQRMK
jgi:hypothetical protein